jgi:hypothetical protein
MEVVDATKLKMALSISLTNSEPPSGEFQEALSATNGSGHAVQKGIGDGHFEDLCCLGGKLLRSDFAKLLHGQSLNFEKSSCPKLIHIHGRRSNLFKRGRFVYGNLTYEWKSSEKVINYFDVVV